MNIHQGRGKKGGIGQRELDRLIGAFGGAREVEDIYPLSGLQRGLLFHSLYAPQSAVYVVSVTCRLGGPLDVAAFRRAWQHVVERHAVLRTAFVGHELDRPVQVVRRRATLPFELHDWRGVPPAEQDQRFAALLAEDRARGFDFAAPPLMRLHLMRVAEAEWRLIWNSHHILFDGWSLPVLLDEVLAGYAAFSRGETPRLAPVRPFRDYIGWLQRQDMAAAQTWWRDRLAGFTAPTALGIDRLAAAAGIRYAEHDAAVAIELAELERFARRHKLTVNTLVQGAWALLLARYADSDEVVFGVTVAGRPAELPEVERTVGLFINTLPLRLAVPPGQTVADWLHTVQARQTELIEHQYSPLSDVQRCSELPPGTALFDSIVAFENYPAEMAAAADITRTIRITEVRPVERTNYPLTLQVALGAALSLRLIYDADRFAADAIARMVGHFTRLLGGLIADPARPLSALSPLDAAERRQLIAPPADRTSWRQDRCLHEVFAGQAARTPDAVALSCADETLSYGELDSRANRLAHHLRALGVGPDVVVGLCVERSLGMVVGLLAILKAGGAYLPLDPGLPPDRLAYMLADARAPVLIIQDALADLLPESEAVRIRLDADAPAIARQPATAPDSGADPLNLAYVIYTSGSTGRPKGTLVTHDCVTRLFAATDSWFAFGPTDVWTLFHSFAFDFSVWELFGALLHGGRLVIVPYWVSRSPEQFHALLAREAVTVLNQTPSAFAQLVRADAAASRELALRLVIFGGEALNLAELAPWFERHGDTRPQLVNMYGITETTVHVTFRPVRMADLAAGTSPIGTPIPDLQLHVLDRHREPLPLGVAGEMHVGGAGLARGYLGRPALTAERFVPNPFAAGERLYRTGDLARRTADGGLDYLGRIDHQVKVRGFRIEPGEIEAALLAHPAIDQAAVLVRQDADDRRLVAYVVGRGDAAPDSSELRSHLQRSLPDYMVPAAFVALDHLPLTSNGKLDRKALPAPEARSRQTYVAPRNAAEQALAGILAGVLGLDRVGIDDNFFELGGDSLLATRAAARVQHELGADLPLRTLFELPTVARLAECLRMTPAAFGPALVTVGRDQPLALSHAQERLWFLEQLGLVGGGYNIGLSVRLVGRLDAAALAAALSEVVRRHEALRTRFASHDEAAVQVIDPPWPIALEPLAVAPDEAGEQARAIMQQRFDLAHDRLLRVALLQLAADQHVLVLAMHHVVSDGWSIGVLVREVEALYAAFAQGRPSPLPELPVQYADYAVWQRRWLADGALERQLAYWTNQLAGAPAALELPTDRPRPAVPSFRGAVHHFTIDPARTAALANLARQDGTTLFMLLLAAFQVLLARWSGQYDVVVGTPIAGRTRAETEGLIGFFVNMLALRSRLDGAASFRSVLHGVKAAALDAYAHQDLPFEKLVEALHPIRDLSREPVVQAVFALQNMPQQPTRMAGLAIEPFDTGPVPAKFDLELSMVEADGALAASIVYATDLFDATTIERLAGHLARLLDAIVADPERRISELPLLGEAERRQLAAWTGTVAPFPEDRCLQDLFAAQAARTPDAPAVICEDRTLSYRELDRRTNRLAHHLRALGVGPDVVVGLSMTRSPDLVIGVLGILKAGGAYLPLDPGYPADRLAYMLADARVPVLLTQSPLVDRLPVHAATLVQLDADAPQIARWPDTPPPGATDPHHLAYVIYTSGSTGRPKGVMIPHRGAMNLAEAQLTRLPLDPTDRILQFASISFDAAVWDLLMAWRAGAALVLADPHDLMPGEPLRELITRQRITTVLLPPSALAALPVAELSCLTTLIVGGEACAAEQLRPWLAGRTVLNAYGPTEASVCTTLFDCGPDERRPPIGRPLPNTRTYVLDERLEPVPIGVAGELFIGGAGLARGYLARPALTAERFVPNPFAPGERLYRTGDRVRWRADGELEFLGRLDTQVKIRGFRIEPGEIEAALLAQPGIEHAIVIARDDAVGKRLVAYLVGRADAVADAGELRRKLQQTLPDYMVPAAFVTLDRLPLTPNGKLDRTALPAPEWNAGADYVAPRNPLETILAGLFAELLGINRIGVNDNFFEAGGHSLLAMRLVSHVRAALGVSLPVRSIFMSPTVAELAIHTEQALTNEIEAMTADEIETALGLADEAGARPTQ